MQHRSVAAAVLVLAAVAGAALAAEGRLKPATTKAKPATTTASKPATTTARQPTATYRADSAYAAAPAQLPTLGPLDARGRVTYFIADGTAESAYKASDRELARWALDAWERAAGGTLHFEASPEEDALVRVNWVPASSGQYGEMRSMLVRGRRGAAVFVRPDTDALGADIARLARTDALLRDTIVYLTCLHELGHALGLAHTAEYRDIMYFFGYGGDIPGFFGRYRSQLRTRDDIGRVSGLSDADVERLRMLYN